VSRIELKNIDKFYGSNHVLKDLSLTIEDGDFMTLLGPSGCGKTTTLRVISGLERPQAGTMTIDGNEVINCETAFYLPPSKRNLNLVFQSYALWPHMTVFKNIAFGLKIKKMSSKEIEQKVHNALKTMRISEFADRYPNELSGGQQQRVAIARAIASDPKLLLLDEPLSNLDAKLRIDMRSELKRLHIEMGTTIIYVTHDQVEALTMSTKIALFKEGVLSQVTTPIELYMNPIDLSAADFIGNPRINFVPGTAKKTADGLAVRSELGEMVFHKDNMTEEETPDGEFACIMGIRPEQIHIARKGEDLPETKEDRLIVRAKVYTTQPAGSETLVTLKVGQAELLAKEIGISEYGTDEEVTAYVGLRRINVYNEKTTRLIKRATSKHLHI
jgi:multiple sugar transport system ATP-binding protein